MRASHFRMSGSSIGYNTGPALARLSRCCAYRAGKAGELCVRGGGAVVVAECSGASCAASPKEGLKAAVGGRRAAVWGAGHVPHMPV
eukprot:scaffold255123_cov36-Tisochrysis_lutea.AAC.2